MRQTLEVQSQNGRPRWELSALLSVLALLAAAAGAKLGAATRTEAAIKAATGRLIEP